MTEKQIARFLSFIIARANGCWEWTGPRHPAGYGRLCVGWSRWEMAYRLAYEYFVGPIAAGMHVDHLCRNRLCVNPTHLEPVTQRENIRRGKGCRESAVHVPHSEERKQKIGAASRARWARLKSRAA